MSEYWRELRYVLGHLTDSIYIHAEPLLKVLYPNFDSLSVKEKDNYLERIALKSVTKNWSAKQIKNGYTPEYIINMLKTDKDIQHELSQQAIELAKQF